MVYMYYTSGSYSSTSAPSIGGSSSILFSTSWLDSSGYSQITSYSSNSIVMKIQRGANMDFSNVYYMSFRFYT